MFPLTGMFPFPFIRGQNPDNLKTQFPMQAFRKGVKERAPPVKTGVRFIKNGRTFHEK